MDLIKLDKIRCQAAIVGQVTDAQTGQPLPAAQVRITSGPPEFLARLAMARDVARLAQSPDLAVTDPDGYYRYLDLPKGNYTLSAALPAAGSRYGSDTKPAAVARDHETGTLTADTANLALPPTGIQGKVTGPAGPVSMAEVRVQGSGECVYTNAQGEYRLLGVETGTRSVRFGARNFQSNVQSVVLEKPGDLAHRDVVLAPIPPPPPP